jgi:hypothetical protein
MSDESGNPCSKIAAGARLSPLSRTKCVKPFAVMR